VSERGGEGRTWVGGGEGDACRSNPWLRRLAAPPTRRAHREACAAHCGLGGPMGRTGCGASGGPARQGGGRALGGAKPGGEGPQHAARARVVASIRRAAGWTRGLPPRAAASESRSQHTELRACAGGEAVAAARAGEGSGGDVNRGDHDCARASGPRPRRPGALHAGPLRRGTAQCVSRPGRRESRAAPRPVAPAVADNNKEASCTSPNLLQVRITHAAVLVLGLALLAGLEGLQHLARHEHVLVIRDPDPRVALEGLRAGEERERERAQGLMRSWRARLLPSSAAASGGPARLRPAPPARRRGASGPKPRRARAGRRVRCGASTHRHGDGLDEARRKGEGGRRPSTPVGRLRPARAPAPAALSRADGCAPGPTREAGGGEGGRGEKDGRAEGRCGATIGARRF
jgi:hypothetical protein